jgi:3-hydroxyacyl-CoA dehydrogenase/enoyl-CoA hydratase/3-hydroxybutyryl-CoA epimerase
MDGISRPSEIKPTKTLRVGVLGSGLMGHGIAYVTALAGINVVMIDISQEKADKGLNRIKTILNDSCKKGFFPKTKINEVLSRVNATDNYSQLDGCDLIIEAVYEDRYLKAKVTKEAEQFLARNGIFASNTSSIPITSLAKNIINPQKFIGIHFFSPVNKMKLVEIIKGNNTNSETLAKAFDYVIKINKVPIVVNDSRGFYTYRVFERYIGEGMAFLSEGTSAQSIEAAGEKAGFPVGPLAVSDEISIELIAHIRDQKWRDLESEGKDVPTGSWDNVINFMTKEVKRNGRASGSGFYEYPKNKKKYLWPKLNHHFPLSDTPLDEKEMIDRFYFIQAIETIRCFEEGVLTRVADANIGSIYGWGFPAFTGGTLQFVNNYGIREFKNRSEELFDKYGARFSCPKLIDEMIKNGETF